MLIFRSLLLGLLLLSGGTGFYIAYQSATSGTAIATLQLHAVQDPPSDQVFLSADIPMDTFGNPYRINLDFEQKGVGGQISFHALVEVEQTDGGMGSQVVATLENNLTYNPSQGIRIPFYSSRSLQLGLLEVPKQGSYRYRLRINDKVTDLLSFQSERFKLVLKKNAYVFPNYFLYCVLAFFLPSALLLIVTHPANLKKMR